MTDYKFFDDDIERVTNRANIGNPDVLKIAFRLGTEAINIHKDDVIFMAKILGLVVYECDAAL